MIARSTGMPRFALLLALLVSLVAADQVAPAEQRVVRFQARAFDLGTGSYLYTEHHAEHYQGGRHVFSDVSYRRGARTLAQKRITFRDSRVAPDYRTVDMRTGYEEGVQRSGGRVRMFARRSSAQALEQRQLGLPQPAVVDGGFDYFIRDNWDALVSGRALYVNFAVPIEMDYFQFRIERVGETIVNGRPAHRFRFRIASRFLALLAESIYVDYDKENRRLLQYRGISNINNEHGRSYRARIVFDYGSAVRPGE